MKIKNMKKISLFLAMLVIGIIVFSSTAISSYAKTSAVWNGEATWDFARGSGTKTDPFIIETAEQLAYFAQSVNDGYSFKGEYIKLEADILLNDEAYIFDADTGLVMVLQDWNIYYLGTGILGDSGGNTTFDATASIKGAWYLYDYSTQTTTCPDNINVWTPIGTGSRAFKGIFDGNGHTIYGLYINNDSNYQGLFGYIENATIKNVGISDSYINGNQEVGAVVGYARAYGPSDATIIENCHNEGIVVGKYEVGGIVGNSYAMTDSYSKSYFLAKNCYNDGIIYSSSGSVGGIVGKNEYNGLIEDCYNSGYILGKDYIGGVVGFNDAFSLDKGTPTTKNCYNRGEVKGLNQSNGYSEDVGGITGRNENSIVDNCYNFGNITGYDSVGGIVGNSMSSSSVSNCYNIGKITGYECSIGGIVGCNSTYSSTNNVIKNCYNTGDVILVGQFSDVNNYSDYDGFLGGVVGKLHAGVYSDVQTIENCYNTGFVSGSIRVGGVIGGTSKEGKFIINKCYNTGAVDGKFYVGGVAGNFGSSGSQINNCYNAGSINGNSDVGGLIGYKFYYGTLQNCYNVGEVTGYTNVDAITSTSYNITKVYYLDTCVSAASICGIALTEEQMKNASSFVNFDFDTIWDIEIACGYDYPSLKGLSPVHNRNRNDCEISICTNCGKELPALVDHVRNSNHSDCENSACIHCGMDMPAIAEHIRHSDILCVETVCTVCNVTLPATMEHSWGDGVIITEPTCTTVGSKTYTCTVCAEMMDEEIALVPHNEVVDEAVPPTCTQIGLTEGKHCADCGFVVVAQSTINALGHNWLDATVTSPKTCDICGAIEGDKLPNPEPTDPEDPIDPNPTPDPEPTPKKDHNECEEKASGLDIFWNAIVNFFRKLFGLAKKCICGEII